MFSIDFDLNFFLTNSYSSVELKRVDKPRQYLNKVFIFYIATSTANTL